MKKGFHMLLIVMTIAILGSCNGDKFKIDGQLANLDGNEVRVVFDSDSGSVDMTMPIDKKGRFSFSGQASQPTIITLCNRQGEPLTTIVAANGDHIKLKGDAGKAMGIQVKGNRLNEDWQLFRKEHGGFYSDPNPSRLDAAIEKYVREHPEDMLSTVLLINDYSNFTDRDKVDQLLHSINKEARPESLTAPFTGTSKQTKASLPRLMSLTLWKHSGAFEEIKLTGQVTLLSLWANPQTGRAAVTSKLQNGNNDVQVIDILTESDTLRWHKTIADDPKEWKHFWAPSGPLEQGIQLLGINSMPWYAVTDSTGLVVYSGPDLTLATKKARDIIDK